MPQPFFPDPVFGWLFVVALATPLAVASWVDYRKMTVPKWVSLGTALGGILFSVARCAWLGSNGQVAWLISPPGPVLGMLDGLLFSTAGLATGFAIFFGLWVLGICGGGDVKLVAAVGAWLGPMLTLYALVFALPVVVLAVLVTYIASALGVNLMPKGLDAQPGQKIARPRRRLLTFSFPLTAGTMLLLFFVFAIELRILDLPAAGVAGR